MAIDVQVFCNCLRRMGRSASLSTALNFGQSVANFAGFSNLNETDVIARMLFSEARGESYEGKRGCAFLLRNRRAKNLSEFGGNTLKNIVLHGNGSQFAGMTTASARDPGSIGQLAAWSDCMDIAANIESISNPIGGCLWFWTNTLFNSRRRVVSGVEQIDLVSGSYRDVVEKVIIGNHTFFRVTGY
jgi:hypothetical protein